MSKEDIKYRGFTIGRDWDRDTWGWCVYGFMRVSSGKAISVQSDWYPVEREDELWDAVVDEVRNQIDRRIEELSQPVTTKEAKFGHYFACYLYEGYNPSFHWYKEDVIASVQSMIDNENADLVSVDYAQIDVVQKWMYYFRRNQSGTFENEKLDVTNTNSRPNVYETRLYGNAGDYSFVVQYYYNSDEKIRVYVHDTSEEHIADTVAKAFGFFAAKEAILNQLLKEQKP